jgi:predicted transcriptional regulator
MGTAATSVRIPKELQVRLDELARATGRSRNFLVTEALQRYVEQEAWQVGQITEGLRALEHGDIATEAEMQEVWDRWTTPEGMEHARLEARRAQGC